MQNGFGILYYRPRVRATKQIIRRSAVFLIDKNTVTLWNVTFIFGRCFSSSAALTQIWMWSEGHNTYFRQIRNILTTKSSKRVLVTPVHSFKSYPPFWWSLWRKGWISEWSCRGISTWKHSQILSNRTCHLSWRLLIELPSNLWYKCHLSQRRVFSTHDKTATLLLTLLQNTFSWIKMLRFDYNFFRNLLLRIKIYNDPALI